MITRKQESLERELKKIEKRLKVITGVDTRHKLIKRQQELKKEIKNSRRK